MTATDSYDPLGLGSPTSRPAPRIRIASAVTGQAEVDAVTRVLESGVLTNGPRTKGFEDAMAARHETAHAVAFANGTVALAAMYLALDIGPGDEVIVPSFTFISTATSVLHVGATPVFADVLEDSLNIDPDDVARRITSRTRAIVPVHYGGQSADMDRVLALADDSGIAVLEDAAEAHGASFGGRPVGGLGRAAMFSFTPTKHITTGEGSIVTTNDADMARRMRLLRNHGMSAPYHHEMLGWNWRLTEIQSAIGECQVERLDEIIATKRAHAATLDRLLADISGVTPPCRQSGREHTFMMYTVQIHGGRRDTVRDALEAEGIESRIYFPPAHQQPIFGDADHDLPVTDAIAERVLSLPVHAKVQDGDLEEIARVIAKTLGTGS